MSQIAKELQALKDGDFSQARQFVEHLVNILTRQAVAVGANSEIPQEPDDNFWGYVFNYVTKEVDLELPAMYAVTYRKNQLTLLFNPNIILPHYDVLTMIEGLRHEGYHLLFNHLKVHAKLDNQISNIAADCEINQKLKKPADEWVSLDYVADLAGKPLSEVKPHAGSLYYYELISQNSENNGLGQNNQQGSGQEQDGQGQSGHGQPGHNHGMCSSQPWQEAQVGQNGNYIPAEITIESVMKQALREAKSRGTVSSAIDEAVAAINKPPQVKWQQEVRRKMGRQVSGRRQSPNRLYRRNPNALHKKGELSDRLLPILFAFDISGSVSKDESEVFFNEIVQMVKKTKHPVTQLQFDSDVVYTQTIDGSNYKKLNINRFGCGGTTFQSVFDYLKENNYPRETQVFIFTDGGGESAINVHGYKDYTWLLTDENQLSVRGDRNKIIRVKSHD